MKYKKLLYALLPLGLLAVCLAVPGAVPRTAPETAAGAAPEFLTETAPVPLTEAPTEAPRVTEEARDAVPFTLLLIGQDRRPGEERARSDAMILCTLKGSRLTLTSLLRDLYVRIPGHGSNRINAAYAFGGPELLQDTLEENFGIRADGTLEVDFEGFARLMDLLGGVRLELREDERQEILKAVPEAPLEGDTPLLNGSQALAYVRIRKLDADGDFSRTQRQRKLLSALAGQLQACPLPKLLQLAAQALPLVHTDLSAADILDLSMKIFSCRRELSVIGAQIPPEGVYASQCIHGMSVLVAEEAAVRAVLQETLWGG